MYRSLDSARDDKREDGVCKSWAKTPIFPIPEKITQQVEHRELGIAPMPEDAGSNPALFGAFKPFFSYL